jgi:integrase
VRKTIDLASAIQAQVTHVPTELTLSELVRAYSACHADAIDLRLRKWLAAFGEANAWSVSSEQLETAAQAMVAHGYSCATANRDLSSLGTVYRWAKAKRMSPRGFRSPTLGVSRFEETIRRVHVEPEQLQALLARALAWPDRRFGVFVSLLMDTGARKSELLERQWSDIDLERREVLAPVTKNGTPRVLFFKSESADLIKRVYPRRDANALLFQGSVPRQPVTFRRAWVTVTREVGLPDLHMHDIRHAAAASLLRSGVTLGVAAQVLGHDPAVLARRYGHLETETLRKAQQQAWSHAG